jgi:hypothetical protein
VAAAPPQRLLNYEADCADDYIVLWADIGNMWTAAAELAAEEKRAALERERAAAEHATEEVERAVAERVAAEERAMLERALKQAETELAMLECVAKERAMLERAHERAAQGHLGELVEPWTVTAAAGSGYSRWAESDDDWSSSSADDPYDGDDWAWDDQAFA